MTSSQNTTSRISKPGFPKSHWSMKILVTLDFTVLHKLHVLTIVITINYALLNAVDPKSNSS